MLYDEIKGSVGHRGFTAGCSCRTAIEGQLWGPALLLARSCGDKAFAETAAAMASSAFAPGTPLHSLSHVLAGRQDLLLPMAGSRDSPQKQKSGPSSGGFNLKALLTSSPSKVSLSQWLHFGINWGVP